MMQAETFGGGYKVAPGMHPFGDSASIVLGFGLSKGQMLRVMGPLEKGNHIGRWNKITMEPCTTFEIKALDTHGDPTEEHGHDPPLFISLDGEIRTPESKGHRISNPAQYQAMRRLQHPLGSTLDG